MLLQWTKQAIPIHTPGQRLQGDSSLSQEVCHHHSPWAGLAHNQQLSHKVFSTCLNQIPWCLALCLTSSSSLQHYPTLCRCPARCLHPSRHSAIPLTAPLQHSPSNSSPLSLSSLPSSTKCPCSVFLCLHHANENPVSPLLFNDCWEECPHHHWF